MVQSELLKKYSNIKHYFLNKYESGNLCKLGFREEDLVYPQQIHGNKIANITFKKAVKFSGFDGLLTQGCQLIGIRTADCLPIFFYDRKYQIIAAVHAGWKGLYTDIITNTLTLMKKSGSDAIDIISVIGPHIQKCCYEVSEKLIKIFRQKTGDIKDIEEIRSNKRFLDLSRIAYFQLTAEGIKDSNIDISHICTSCNNDYYSFRRDHTSKRMINILGQIK